MEIIHGAIQAKLNMIARMVSAMIGRRFSLLKMRHR